MANTAREPVSVERRASIPFAAIGAARTRQTSQPVPGCPCCGAPVDVAKPFVDMKTHALVYKDSHIHLERNEALIMEKLTQRMPGVVAHDSLISHVWNLDEPGNATNCIKQHVHNLRRKLEPLGLDIANIFTVGYRLVTL